MTAALDDRRLQEALAEAERAIGLSDPNPRVGCVIGSEDGRVLGIGHTQAAGQAHAEVMALRAALAAGHEPRGATAWVTLEPCAHHGRTPPCCDALADAGLARVVVAGGDPFPGVAGEGLRRLRERGVRVDVLAADHPLAQAARELNIGFFSRLERGRPWVRLKVAISLDGRTALPDGTSQWITGPQARADTHAWRRRAGAVLTGIQTVLADDPRLDVRLVNTAHQPLRVVADSRLRLPDHARILAPPGRVLILAATAHPQRTDPLRQQGHDVLLCPSADGRVDLAAALGQLAQRGINEVHVEAGQTLNAALLDAGLVDELLAYVAPVLLGPGHGLRGGPALVTLGEARRWRFVETLAVGSDLRLRLRPA